MNVEECGKGIIIVTTVISIIFMLNLKISYNAEGMMLPEEEKTEKQISIKDRETYAGRKESDTDKYVIHSGDIKNKGQITADTQSKNDDKSKNLKEEKLSECKPNWSEIEKRVKGKRTNDYSFKSLNIKAKDINIMIKAMPATDKRECINIISNLDKKDIKTIVDLYRDGVSYDDGIIIKNIVKNALDKDDYEKLKNVAKAVYINNKSNK